MNPLFLDSDPDDFCFSRLLDLFTHSERVVCFSQPSNEEEIDSIIEKVAAGQLSPVEVQELLGRLRSYPSAIARLATLLQKTKETMRE